MDNSAPRARPRLALMLLLATLCTTTWSGMLMSESALQWFRLSNVLGAHARAVMTPWWQQPQVWLDGLSFSLSLLFILGAHELGHYATARRHGVNASLPYFIPFLPALGTLGAIIRMSPEPMPARSMLRIAAFGPFAGALAAVPVYLVGLMLSRVIDVRAAGDEITLMGTGLLGRAMERAVMGAMPVGHDVFLHPMAFAAWVGLLLTALNLVPSGQLDGGHIGYAMFGKRWERGAVVVAWLLVPMGLLLSEAWLMVLLMVRLSGVRHPPMITDGRVQGGERWIGWAAAALFVLTFAPRPIIHPDGPPIVRLATWGMSLLTG